LVAFSVKVLGLVEAHRAVFAAAATLLALVTLALLAVFLPSPHYRATPAFLLMLGSFFAGVLADRSIK
jgi:hypothetical protein